VASIVGDQFVFFLSCGTSMKLASPFIHFKDFRDLPVPSGVTSWLQGGEQSIITPRIAREASKIKGSNKAERLIRTVRYVCNTYQYDPSVNSQMFEKSADMLVNSRTLGGCGDYALVVLGLLRACEIPARLVLTANIQWMK
jgi:transglutaminase-like putative cysteine protease